MSLASRAKAALGALRWPQPGEIRRGIGYALAACGLLWAGTCIGGPVAVQEVRAVHVDTVTAAKVRAQEPPAKPGIVTRIVYREVQPERVQVAPGAGKDVLAAVCGTTKRAVQLLPDGPAGQDRNGPVAAMNLQDTAATRPAQAPALAYAWRVEPTWLPWRDRVRLFAVGQDGETVTDFRVSLPAEGRLIPTAVVREARVPVKRLVTLGAFVAAGYVAGRLSR